MTKESVKQTPVLPESFTLVGAASIILYFFQKQMFQKALI